MYGPITNSNYQVIINIMFATLQKLLLSKTLLRYGFTEYVKRDNMQKLPISTTSKHYNKQFYNPEYHQNIMEDGPELLHLSHKKNPPSRLDFSEVWDAYYQVVRSFGLRSQAHSCSAQCSFAVCSILLSQSGPSTTLMRRVRSVSISEENTL